MPADEISDGQLAQIPSEVLEKLSQLQNNLRNADEIPDPQLSALNSLAYLDAFLAYFGIKGKTLGRLRNALFNVYQGHERSLFKPRRATRPRRTLGQQNVQVHAALLMQLLMDDDEKEKAAAKAAEKVLDKAGFRLSQGSKLQKATATTVINWRKGLTSKSADRWASNFYRGLLKQLRPSKLTLLMGAHDNALRAARKRAIEVAREMLKKVIAKASES